jgi:hypothetical protein
MWKPLRPSKTLRLRATGVRNGPIVARIGK